MLDRLLCGDEHRARPSHLRIARRADWGDESFDWLSKVFHLSAPFLPQPEPLYPSVEVQGIGNVPKSEGRWAARDLNGRETQSGQAAPILRGVKSALFRFEIGDEGGNPVKRLLICQLTCQPPEVLNSPLDFDTLGAHAK